MAFFFPTVTQAKSHLALSPDPESFDFAGFFQQWNFFSAISLPSSAKNQEYLWPTLFYPLAGDNIQFVIIHLV